MKYILRQPSIPATFTPASAKFQACRYLIFAKYSVSGERRLFSPRILLWPKVTFLDFVDLCFAVVSE